MDSSKKGARLLIVEDEGLVAMSINRYLTNIGYEVCGSVSTGVDAVEQSRTARPDVVLMDIRLEGAMDGIEAAEKISSELDIPVVFLTSYSDSRTLDRAKLTSPFGYVMKPFDEDRLRVGVEMALYKAKMEKRLQKKGEELETILGSLDEGVIVGDGTGHLAYMNAAAKELLGVSDTGAEAALLLRELFRIFDAETRAPLTLPIERATGLGERSSMDGVLLASANGQWVPIECTLVPLGERSAPEGVVVSFRNTTDRYHAEKYIEGELKRATELHRSLLPQNGTRVGRVEMRMFFRPAAAAGGDVFNFFAVDDTHAVLYVIDVVGHGVSAAGVSILLHRLLSPSSEAQYRYPFLDVDARYPGEVIQQLNRLFFLASQNLFFTILYAVINTESGEVRFARGGHPYPIKQQADGAVEVVLSEGGAVGITESMTNVEQKLRLSEGDRLFMYTDGLTDSTNRKLEHYSQERLLALFRRFHGKPLADVVASIEADLEAWSSHDVEIDDISLIGIEYR